MMEWLLSVYPQAYLLAFCGGIALVALLEGLWPRRELRPPIFRRWLSNIAILLIDIGVVRLVYPLLGVSYALWIAEQGWGLMPMLSLPLWLAIIIALILQDFNQYLMHWLMHRVPWLWRLHRVHHTDQEYDFSTGLRFHPIEGIFTSGGSLLLLTLLGPPIEAVMIFGLFQVVWGSVVHGNIHLPEVLDQRLRRVVVTPDLHRTHHSVRYRDSVNNLGGILPVWDHLFGTYREQPSDGHQQIQFGLTGYDAPKHQRLDNMLLQPFMTPRHAVAPRQAVAPDNKTDDAEVNSDLA